MTQLHGWSFPTILITVGSLPPAGFGLVVLTRAYAVHLWPARIEHCNRAMVNCRAGSRE
jgi:hypothetical protein